MPSVPWNPLVPELTVTDLERALAFYTELLGFAVRFQRDDPPFAYLDLGGAQLMLEQQHTGAWLTAELAPPFGRGINFQIEVPDLQPILNRLAAAERALFRQPAETWYATDTGEEGQREVLVQDPDGYLLRLMQPLGTRPWTVVRDAAPTLPPPDAAGCVTLYRPVGDRELALIAATGYRAFPPRLPNQPIFYPVLNERYATEIAQRMNAIRPWLWIGGYRDSCNRAGLAASRIVTLLQLAADVRHPGITTIYLPIDDGVPVAPSVFDQGIAAIREAHAHAAPILVACGAGISRSATVAIAGLWAVEGLPLLNAWRAVKTAHPPTFPHPALWESLCTYSESDIPYISLLRDA